MIRQSDPVPWADRFVTQAERRVAAPSGEPQPHLLGSSAETPVTHRRRNARLGTSASGGAALRDAVESLRHTIRFLEELMASRQAEAERASSRAQADLRDLRQRIEWFEELRVQERS